MIFIGIGKVTRKDGVVTERRFLIDVTEDEADKITGIAGRPHIANRYKVGREVDIASIYDKVKRINDRHTEIVAAARELQSDAADMVDAIPLTGD